MERKEMVTQFSFFRRYLLMYPGLSGMLQNILRSVVARTLLMSMILVLSSLICQGQNDITISLAIPPPYTPKIIDYFSQPNKVMLTIKNNTERTVDAYMNALVTDNGKISVSSDPKFRKKLTLQPYGVFRLNQTNYTQVIDEDHLLYNGISKKELVEGRIPENEYSLCISAFDAKNNLLSGEEMGCVTFTIRAVEPPATIRPECGINIKEMAPQNLLLSWTIPVGAPAITDFTVKIIEVYPTDKNLFEAMLSPSHQVFFEKKTNINSCLLGPADPALIIDKRYAFAVIASDPNKVITFNNNGMSNVCDFTYGGAGTGEIIPDKTGLVEIQLLEPADSIQNTTPSFKWQPKTELRNATYSLNIVEQLDGQNPMEALTNNKPLWTVTGIKELYTRYPFGKPALDSNKTYVWTVEATGQDGKTKGKGGAKGLTLGGTVTQLTLQCMCAFPMNPPPTTFYKCQHDIAFGMQQFPFLATCPSNAFWRDELGNDNPATGLMFISPAALSCGVHQFAYLLKKKSDNSIICYQKYTVYIFPDYITIKNTGTGETVDNLPGSPPLNFCTGDFGELAIPSCSTFPVTWHYRQGGPWLTWCPPGSPCTDNPIATNQLNVGPCNSYDINGDAYVLREYRATLTAPAGFGPWPCSNIQTIKAKIYCKTQCGSFAVSSTTHPLISQVNSNTWKVCSSRNPTDPIPYPIGIDVIVSGFTGHILRWVPGTGTNQYHNLIYGPGSTNPFTVTYEVHIQNGPCDSLVCLVNIIVYDRFDPLIENKKDWVCPNKEDDELCISNPAGLPTGATIQWEYQTNCLGIPANWHHYLLFGGNGNCQNTNLIGDQNPYYNHTILPLSNPVISNSLCWQVKITPPPGSPCTWVTTSPVPTSFHGKINLIIKPGKPNLSVNPNPVPPPCCPANFTLTATPNGVTPGTPGYSWMWYKDNVPVTSIIPDMSGRTYTASAPGDYFVVVYNMNLCDTAKSDVVHLKCCSVKVSLDAPCCVDGVTPVTITVHSSSDCGHQITSLNISGCDGFSFNFTNPPPALVVPINPYPSYPAPVPPCPSDREWKYTVTVTDIKGCKGVESVIIKTCPPAK
ncbi:MAG: hypothetical protein D4R97_06240 [Bacteroidetes bacterium]|nr:MAG: hypothetical protein D4R97_06240 [Bacteroidota bacterium]